MIHKLFCILIALRVGVECAPGSESLTSCNSTSPLNTSENICFDLCEQGAPCLDSGACLCKKEPTPTMLGGNFVHCTNWNYVEQKECKNICSKVERTNNTRVCWTFDIGNYCTCF